MITIEERAEKCAWDLRVIGHDCESIVKQAYIKGAEDQIKESSDLLSAHIKDYQFSVDKATDWLTKQFDGASRITIGKYTIPVNIFLDNFRKAMRYDND